MIADGIIAPMELAHLPYRRSRSYEDVVGAAGLKRLGEKRWNKRVLEVIELLKAAVEADYVVLGGGNARMLEKVPPGANPRRRQYRRFQRRLPLVGDTIGPDNGYQAQASREMSIALPFTGLLFGALTLQAAAVDVVPSQKLDKLQKQISGQKIGLTSLGHYTNSSMELIRREASGLAELHQTKADVLVVREGEATLIEGGSIPHAKVTQPHELRGDSITGGARHTLGAGDLIHIPAGVPHQILLAPGKSLTYIAVKISE